MKKKQKEKHGQRRDFVLIQIVFSIHHCYYCYYNFPAIQAQQMAQCFVLDCDYDSLFALRIRIETVNPLRHQH